MGWSTITTDFTHHTVQDKYPELLECAVEEFIQ